MKNAVETFDSEYIYKAKLHKTLWVHGATILDVGCEFADQDSILSEYQISWTSQLYIIASVASS